MALQSSPEHVSLDALVVLAARLIALPVFRRSDPASIQGEFLRRFCIDINAVGPVSDIHLSDFLKHRLKIAETYADGLTPAERASLSPKLTALHRAIRAVNCARCAGPGGRRCDGRSPRRDDEQIDRVGLCLGTFRQMHHYVVEMLTAVLRAWVPGDILDTDAPLPHDWGTASTAEAKHQGPTVSWKAGGSTEFQDSRKVRRSRVQLVLNVEELDWDSLLAVVWIFTHELFCHVAQVEPLDRQPRAACRTSCPFFEGWMDKVAYWLLEADQMSPWSEAESVFVTQHRDEILQAAGAYRQQRYGIGPGLNRLSVVPQWELGVETARTVRQFLEITSPQVDEGVRRRIALGQLVTLSFRIQRAGQMPRELDTMLNALMLATSLQLEGGSLRDRARLVGLLTSSIIDKDIWIKELQKLSRSG